MKTNNFLHRVISVVAIAIAAVTQVWAQEFEKGGIKYTVNSETPTEVYVSGHSLSGDNGTLDIVIPQTVENEGNTYTVTSIGYEAFVGLYATKTVKLPSTIKTIADRAFYDNYYLETIEFNEGLESIGAHAFGYNWRMKDIILPSTLKTISNVAFQSCGQNSSEDHTLVLPENLSFIGDGAFQNCSHIKNVYCYAPFPPVLDGSPFSGTIDNATLYVATSALENYANLEPWSNFSGGIQTVDYNYTQCISPRFTLEDYKLTITAFPADAKIYYTDDNTDPTTGSTLYTGPIAFEKNDTIRAIAVKDGYDNSPISKFVKNDFTLDRPSITMSDELIITITSTTQDAKIYYSLTTDNYGGECLDEECIFMASYANYEDFIHSHEVKEYTEPFKMDKPQNVYAWVEKVGWNKADKLVCYNTSKNRTINIPSINWDLNTKEITITHDDSEVTIYYSLDGTEPTIGSSVYTEPISFNRNLIVKAIAAKAGHFNSNISEVTITGVDSYFGNNENGYNLGFRLIDNTTANEVEVTALATGEKYQGEIVIPSEVTFANVTYRVTRIGDNAFADCDGLTAVTIPETITNIGYRGFWDCDNLTQVVIPGSVKRLENEAFSGCDRLSSIQLNEGLEYIGEWGFYYVSATQVKLPSTLNFIAAHAFRESSLSSITIPEGVTTIASYTFYGCRNLQSIKLPSSLTSIEREAFCSAGLLNVEMPNSVSQLGEYAFYDCRLLTSAVLSSGLTDVANYAFHACPVLGSISIPEGITRIGWSAFDDCYALATVSLPKSLTVIDGYAFNTCRALSSITIPENVTSIGQNAFTECDALTSIYAMPTTPPAMNDGNAFSDALTRAKVYVSSEAKSAYETANNWQQFGSNIVAIDQVPCAQPTFTLDNYRLTIKTQTPGATIYYNRHNEEPVIDDAHRYTGSFPFTRNDTICAIAVADGYANSPVAYYRVSSFKVPNPVAVIDDDLKVTITCDTPVGVEDFPPTQIFYSFRRSYWDGADYQEYDGQPIQLTRPGYLRTYAERDGWTPSDTPDNNYYDSYRLNQPSYSWDADTHVLTISHDDPEASIYYTLDGSDPSATNGTLYEEPITLGRTLTVKAVAVKKLKFDSDIMTQTFEVNTDFVDNRIHYRLIPNMLADEVEVWNGKAYEGDIVIPEKATDLSGKEYTVTRIAANAFNNCDNLGTVTLPGTLRTIGEYAFLNCNNFKQIDIPSSVETIERGAFQECYDLSDIKLNQGLKRIEESAFRSCGAFTSIALPSTLEYIGPGAFAYCGSLADITLPNSLTSLGYEAFYGCGSLKSINIPSQLTRIETSTFNRTGLTSIEIPANIKEIGSYAFSYCQSLKDVKLTEGLEKIESNAFEYCTALVKVNLPASLKSTASGAFFNCHSLPTIAIPEGITTIEQSTFDDCYALAAVTLPSTLTTIGERAFNTCSALTSITLPASVTTIYSHAFTECGLLNSVYCLATTPPTFPYENPFFDIKADVYVPAEALDIYTKTPTYDVFKTINALDNMPCEQPTFAFDLDSYKLTISTLTAGAKIYYSRHNEEPVIDDAHLYTAPIPFMQNDTIRAIAVMEGYKNSQEGMYGKEDFKVEPPEATISEDHVVTLTCPDIRNDIEGFPETKYYYVLNRNSWNSDGERKLYEGPVTLTEGYWMHVFAKREGWNDADRKTFDFYTDYIKPADIVFTIDGIQYTHDRQSFINVVRVSGKELSGDNGTLDIAIPEKVTNEGVEYTVTAIGDWAFGYLNAAKSLKLPSTIKTIGAQAFRDNYYLEEIDFAEGLESIGEYAFGYNRMLKNIYLPSTIKTIGNCAFIESGRYGEGEQVIVIPANVKHIGSAAFQSCSNVKTVYCYATTLPELGGYPFDGTADHAKLFVPTASLALYQADENWNRFQSIEAVQSMACLQPTFEYDNYKLTIKSATAGAAIRYTTDGTDPTAESTLYTGPIALLKNQTVRAIAMASGFDNSVITEYKKDDFKAEQPTTEVDDNMVMTISSEIPAVEGLPETKYYYNFSGTRNSLEEIIENNDSLYTGPVQLTSPCYVYVVAVRDGWIMSDWNTYNYRDGYTLQPPTVEHYNGTTVNMYSTDTDGTVIYYTLDGSTPTKESNRFEGQFEVERNLIVKAIATKPRHFNSNVVTYFVNDNTTRFDVAGITYKYADYTLADEVEVAPRTAEGSTYEGTISIPETIEKDGKTCKVVSIYHEAFKDCANLTSVTIPTSVTHIGNNAFDGCSQLSMDFTAWENLVSIGNYAFRGTGIKSVTVPASTPKATTPTALTLPNWSSSNKGQDNSSSSFTYCFYADANATLSFDWAVSSQMWGDYLRVYLDGNEIVSQCGENADSYTTTIESAGSHTLRVSYDKDSWNHERADRATVTNIQISAGYDKSGMNIGSYAFAECNALTEATLGSSVTEIGSSAFRSSTSLKTVVIQEGVTEIKDNTFRDCTSLTNISLPTTITTIGSEAFRYCTSLPSITLPAALTSIGSFAFYSCNTLNSVYSMAGTPPAVGDNGFGGITNNADLFVQASAIDAYKAEDAYPWNSFRSIGEFTNIPCAQPQFDYADYKLTITTQTAGASIRYTTDGTDPTAESTLYTGPIALMKNQTVRAIAMATGLDNSLITEFKKEDFKVAALEASISEDYVVTLTSPDARTDIEGFPQTQLYYTVNRSSWQSDYNNTEWKLYEGPFQMTDANWVHVVAKREGWIDSDQQNFDYYNGFLKDEKEFTVDGLHYYYDGKSFVNAVMLTGNELSGDNGSIDLVIPEKITYEGTEYTVTTIGNGAFNGNKLLKSVKFPPTIKTVSDFAFNECSYIEEIEFNEGLESVGQWSFRALGRLKSLNLPSTLKSIGYTAFFAFGNDVSIDKVIVIPASVTYMASEAFLQCNTVNAVYCLTPNLPELGGDPFNGTSDHATLYVPADKLEEYKNAEHWKNFTNIQGMENMACMPPTFSYSDYKLTMKSQTAGAKIYYTDDNSDPMTSATRKLYPNESIYFMKNDTIRAYAEAQGYDNSLITEFRKDDFKVPTPVATLSEDMVLTITCEAPDIEGFPKTKIYYVLNRNSWYAEGEWKLYEGPIEMTRANHLYVRAERDGWNNSDEGHQNFYDDYFLDSPRINIAYADNYNTATVTLTQTDADAIFYTLDGSEPTKESNRYDGTFTINRNYHINAMAIKTGRINSDVSTGTADRIDSKFQSNGVTYRMIDYTLANELEVVGITTAPSGDYSIPEDVTDQGVTYKVVSIGNDALREKSMITLTLPQTIRNIGSSAFYNCTQLNKVVTTAKIETIGNDAFSGCTNLEEYPFNDGLTTIGSGAFSNTKLRSVILPNSVSELGGAVFSYCSNLRSITLSEAIKAVPFEAFYACSELTTLTLPQSVKEIGQSAFYNCLKLTSITIPEGVETIEAETFFNCRALSSVLLPQSLTSIGYRAFGNCSLSSIALHNNVKSIGQQAFSGCTSLRNVVCEPTTPPLMSDGNAFSTTTLEQATLFVREEAMEAYERDQEWSKFTNKTIFVSLPCEQPTFIYADYVLTISSATQGATIYYTTDGTEPTTSSAVCNGSIYLLHNQTVRAIAVAEGYDNSTIAVFTKNDFKVPTPKATLSDDLVMTLSCEAPDLPNFPLTSFYYNQNMNATTAGTEWIPYNGPTQLTEPSYVHVRAERDNWLESDVAHANFYTSYYLAPPNINGTETTSKTVTISHARSGVYIYYTLDGSEPTPESTLYTGAITLTQNTTVKAMATLDKHFNSALAEKTFKSFTLPAPEIAFEGKFCTITCAEEGVAIYYTLDESEPTIEKGIRYTGQFELPQQTTPIKAFAVKDNWNDSPVTSRTFYADASRQAKAPEVLRSGNTNLVTMRSETEGATIYYTTNGANPTVNDAIYTEPIEVEHNLTIKAMATSENYFNSDVTEFEVNWFQVNRPIITVNGVTVTIACAKEDAKIYYTLDGTEPDEESTLYTGALTMTKSCVIMAKAFYENFNPSESTTYEYNTGDNACGTPQFSHDGNTVIITSTPTSNTTIYFTTNGENPTATSEVYGGAFEVYENCTIKAFAKNPNLFDSEIGTYQVNWFKVDAPVIAFDGFNVTITCSTPNSRIYYTTDGTTPDEESLRYTSMLTMKESCTIKAIAVRDNFNSSSVTAGAFDKTDNTVTKPQFFREGNTVTITAAPAEGTTIYYTTDGSEPTERSTIYSAPIETIENMTLRAVAMNPKLFNSEEGTYDVNWFKVEKPVIAVDGTTVTISCATPDAVIHYAYDNVPTAESNVYSGPITIVDNRSIQAVGIKQNFYDSEVTVYTPTLFACSPVEFSYNGRYLEMTANEGATIYYTLDESEPTAQSQRYTGPVDIDSLYTVKAIAMRNNFNRSVETQYVVKYLYTGEEAMIEEAGMLEEVFTWAGTLNNVEALPVKGKVNDKDLAFINTISTLHHLDLSEATIEGNTLPDRAFANLPLVSFQSPKQLSSVGEHLFEGCTDLAAIVWNANTAVPQTVIDDIKNPNLLLYVNLASYVPNSYTGNVILGTSARSITLTDTETGGNFYCPKEFYAEQISYTHQYGQTTPTGEGKTQGWETLSLPFDVQRITHEKNGALAPFAKGENVAQYKPFWLYKLEDTGFARAAEIEAYTPYIISMPNNPNYADDYNLAGRVTFSASGVTVAKDHANVTSKGSVRFTPTMQNQQPTDNVMAINLADYTDADGTFSPSGSAFIANLRQVRPFEAYARVGGGLSRLLIGEFLWSDDTAIHDLEMQQLEAIGEKRGIFDLTGRRFSNDSQILKKQRGQHQRVLIINGKKVLQK